MTEQEAGTHPCTPRPAQRLGRASRPLNKKRNAAPRRSRNRRALSGTPRPILWDTERVGQEWRGRTDGVVSSMAARLNVKCPCKQRRHGRALVYNRRRNSAGDVLSSGQLLASRGSEPAIYGRPSIHASFTWRPHLSRLPFLFSSPVLAASTTKRQRDKGP